MVANTVIDDVRITWKAKGVFTYLLRLPNDWQIYEEEISKHSADGLKSLKSGIKELIKFGYIKRSQMRDEKGRFIGYDYCIHEGSSENPLADNGEPVDGKTVNGKGHATNTDLPNTNLTNTYEEEVQQAYKEVKNRYLNTREKEVLNNLLTLYSKDLILKAIDVMVTDAEKITLKYIISTLGDWKTKDIQTVEQVDKMRTEWQKAKNKPIVKEKIVYGKKESTFNNFEQRTYDFEDLEKKLLGIE